ncbi:MAG: bifunctional ADP-dependent NAD(P)H-hydrate dehydratase/NAD(P)H-hydrate epimerase [Marinilabiliales bacterium]
MKLFKSSQVAVIDKYTIDNEPIASIDLMERAAGNMFKWISNHFNFDRTFQIFAGPGNNGGDALAIARMLAEKKANVIVNIIRIKDKLSNDAEINYQRLIKNKTVIINNVQNKSELPELQNNQIIIDGLFGSGLTRPLSGLAAETVRHINSSKATIIAVDIPSGLFGEDNSHNNPEAIIRADYTLALQFPNISFFMPENYEYVGNWTIIPIGLHEKIINELETDYYQITSRYIGSLIKKRNKFDHKGIYGHALLISGSLGKTGAAVLSGKACLKTGVGLLTVHIPKSGNVILQTSLPEAMTSIDNNDKIVTEIPEFSPYDAVGVGPGIDKHNETVKMLEKLLSSYNHPIVIDADALNIISENKKLIEKIPENSILTPHPKEFDRLFGKHHNTYNRIQTQINNSIKHKIFIVLKGAHTTITTPQGKCWFNTTGNPGMATAGSGDVLTGIILSLLAQKYKSFEAALIAVYLHGLAGDIAVNDTGEHSLIAGDIINNIGNAYKYLQNKND